MPGLRIDFNGQEGYLPAPIQPGVDHAPQALVYLCFDVMPASSELQEVVDKRLEDGAGQPATEGSHDDYPRIGPAIQSAPFATPVMRGLQLTTKAPPSSE